MKKVILTIFSCLALVLGTHLANAQENEGHHHGDSHHRSDSIQAHPHHRDSLNAGQRPHRPSGEWKKDSTRHFHGDAHLHRDSLHAGQHPHGPSGEWKKDSTHHFQGDTTHFKGKKGEGTWDRKKGGPGFKGRGKKE